MAPRAQPVRITLDLAPITHHNLLDWCRQAAITLQVPKVPAASLIRALLVQLEADRPWPKACCPTRSEMSKKTDAASNEVMQ
ncbi:MAG: hypothetical protein ACRDR6_25585 [Pseudonocardiaceae bacterium]